MRRDSYTKTANRTEVDFKFPAFESNLHRGVKIANEILRPKNPPLGLFSVFNGLPSSIASSSNLDDFTMISMQTLQITQVMPLQETSHKIDGSETWGSWVRNVYDPVIVDDSLVLREFYPDDVTISDVEAAALIGIKNNYHGPWLSIELCRSYPEGPVTYAFRRSTSQTLSEVLDLVQMPNPVVGMEKSVFAFCRPPTPSSGSLDGAFKASESSNSS